MLKTQLDATPVYTATFAVEPKQNVNFDIYARNNSMQDSMLVAQEQGVNLVASAVRSHSTYLVAHKVGSEIKLYKAIPMVVQPVVHASSAPLQISKDTNARTTLGEVFGTRKRRTIIKYHFINAEIDSLTQLILKACRRQILIWPSIKI